MSRSGVEPGAAQRIVGGVLSSLQRDHAEHFHMWWSTCSGGPKHFHMGVEHVQNTEILWSSRGFTRSCFLLSSSSKNEVHCVKWWMAHYQSSTPKRHYAYSNSHYIHRLDKGVLQGWKKTRTKRLWLQCVTQMLVARNGIKAQNNYAQRRPWTCTSFFCESVYMDLFWSNLSVAHLNHIVSVVGRFRNHVFTVVTRWPAKHKWAKLHYSRLWYTITKLYITYVASVNSTPKFGKVI